MLYKLFSKKYYLLFFIIVLLSKTAASSNDNIIDSIFTVAENLYKQNNNVEAQKNYLKALHLAEKTNNSLIILNCEKAIARCHYYMRDNESALKWYYNYLNSINKYGADSLLSDAYYIIGAMYIEAEIVDSVKKYSYKAIELLEKEKNYAQLSRTYSTLVELHLNTTKNISEIERLLNEAEKYAVLSQNNAMMAFAASKRYNYYFRIKKDYPKALYYVSKSESLYVKTNIREAILNAYRGKAECLIMMKDTSALTYMTKWFLFKDSIFNAEKALSMAKYETAYETEKKETQIKHQKQLLEKESQAKKLYIVIFSVVILLLVSLFFIYRLRTKHKTELLLKEQNEITIKEIYAAEQNERIRIARDLHDSIGQKLSVIRMLLPDSMNNPDIQKVASYVDETANEVRNISHNLIPEVLNLGLIKAIEDLTEKINATKTVSINFIADKELNKIRLTKQTELSLYRIIQEILSNIVRHAKTDKISIELKYLSGFVKIFIQDNGVGIDINSIKNSQGIGWKNIFARIKLINGNINIESEKNRGSNFIINIPVI